MSTDPRIQQALQYIREGRKSEAQVVMSAVLRENPRNADYWYIAAGAADGLKRIENLKQALIINPNHARARAMLDKLSKSSVSVDKHTPTTKPESNAVVYTIVGLIALVLIVIGGVIIYQLGRNAQVSEANGSLSASVPAPPPATVGASSQAGTCFFSVEQTSAITQFLDTTETANSTARMSLSGVVLELQRQYRAYQRMESADCLAEIDTHIRSAMSFTVDAFQEFLGNSDSALVNIDIGLAIDEYKAAYELIERNGIFSPDYRFIDVGLFVFERISATKDAAPLPTLDGGTPNPLPTRTPRPTLTPLSP